MCCSRLTAWPKVFLQTLQPKGLVPLWDLLTWTSSPWDVENTFKRTGLLTEVSQSRLPHSSWHFTHKKAEIDQKGNTVQLWGWPCHRWCSGRCWRWGSNACCNPEAAGAVRCGWCGRCTDCWRAAALWGWNSSGGAHRRWAPAPKRTSVCSKTGNLRREALREHRCKNMRNHLSESKSDNRNKDGERSAAYRLGSMTVRGPQRVQWDLGQQVRDSQTPLPPFWRSGSPEGRTAHPTEAPRRNRCSEPLVGPLQIHNK